MTLQVKNHAEDDVPRAESESSCCQRWLSSRLIATATPLTNGEDGGQEKAPPRVGADGAFWFRVSGCSRHPAVGYQFLPALGLGLRLRVRFLLWLLLPRRWRRLPFYRRRIALWRRSRMRPRLWVRLFRRTRWPPLRRGRRPSFRPRFRSRAIRLSLWRRRHPRICRWPIGRRERPIRLSLIRSRLLAWRSG